MTDSLLTEINALAKTAIDDAGYPHAVNHRRIARAAIHARDRDVRRALAERIARLRGERQGQVVAHLAECLDTAVTAIEDFAEDCFGSAWRDGIETARDGGEDARGMSGEPPRAADKPSTPPGASLR